MRVIIRNESARDGHLHIDEGDDQDDEDRLKPLPSTPRRPRLINVPAGEEVTVSVTQRGHLVVLGFRARIVAVAKNRKNAAAQTREDPVSAGKKRS